MNVFLWPSFSKQERGEGGIRRVVDALRQWLPEYGVTVVDDVHQADLVNAHADRYVTDLPVAASLHGFYWKGFDWAGWCYEANQRLIRVAKEASSVSVPSKWVGRSLQHGMLINPFVLPHGINPEEYKPTKIDPVYVLWAKTRPDPICDPTPIDELAKRNPSVEFVSTFASGDNANVHVTGRMSYNDSKRLIRDAAVYLGTVMETGGITCLEAMAYGVPVLGFDWGVNPEIIRHKETGYLVPPDDYEALNEGLQYCIANRDRLGQAAREDVLKNRCWSEQIRKYLSFYQHALDGNKSQVKVSVVVTAYNLESYLPACLDSILSQDVPDWECIIVDDHSPDRCGEIADEYARRDHRFRVIHNPTNVYLAEARNIGFRVSRGKYYIPLDADDELAGSALRILSQALDRDRNLDIVTGGFELVDPDGRHWQSGWPSDNPNFDEQVQHRNQVPYASLYRKWVWERTGGYRRRYRTAEDADFWTRAMSYGAKPAKVTDMPTLIYANRSDSMSHAVPMHDWTSWSTWSQFKEITPFGAAASSDDGSYPANVPDFDKPDVSVVIPCGPGHDFYLQDALDSLVAQTNQSWEVIVVNDTGKSWYNDKGEIINPYLAGFPFVRVIEKTPCQVHGVSWARNEGIAAVGTDRFVLFDADDYMQPLMLDVLLKVHDEYGGWVYSDWYKDNGDRQEAKSWSVDEMIVRMLGPMTGLYRKKDWNDVEGFDTHLPGWEDWDFQLSLLENGVCGTRVAMPLFTYRYETGTRRENNYQKAADLLAAIKAKHHFLYDDKEYMMACKSCGGGGGASAVSVGLGAPDLAAENMVLIEFTGFPEQFMSLRSKVNPRRSYRFGGEKNSPSRRFYVYAGDVDWLTSRRDFNVVELPKTSLNITEAPVRLVAETPAPPPQPKMTPLEKAGLGKEILKALSRAGVTSVEQAKTLTLTDLVAIQGMGPARARKVQDAVANFA